MITRLFPPRRDEATQILKLRLHRWKEINICPAKTGLIYVIYFPPETDRLWR